MQVLRNLIANAQSFSPPRGRIWLRAREAGGQVEICVEDEGPGIPDANLEHIFDRFYSERPKGESFGQHSGLGLSISRQIVEALHGRYRRENRRDSVRPGAGRAVRRAVADRIRTIGAFCRTPPSRRPEGPSGRQRSKHRAIEAVGGRAPRPLRVSRAFGA